MLQHVEPVSHLAVQPLSRGPIPPPRARYRAARLARKARRQAAARAPHIANITSVIDRFAVRECGLNDTLDLMLSRVDWDLVKVDAIKSAITLILNNAPASVAFSVSVVADGERSVADTTDAEDAADAAIPAEERAANAARWERERAEAVARKEARAAAVEAELSAFGLPAYRSPFANAPWRDVVYRFADLLHLGLMLEGAGQLEALITAAREIVARSEHPSLAAPASMAPAARADTAMLRWAAAPENEERRLAGLRALEALFTPPPPAAAPALEAA